MRDDQLIDISACHRTWATIETDALLHNYTVLSKGISAVSPSCVSVCVVKADAYGHGVETVSDILWQAGCRHFAVATTEEALTLKRCLEKYAPEKPALVLVLGYTHPEAVGDMMDAGITLTCVSGEHAEALSRRAAEMGGRVSCHIALDTGMNRIGLSVHTPEDIRNAVSDVRHIMRLSGICVTGMFTHFALADEDYDKAVMPDSHTLTQYARYRAVYDDLCATGDRPAFCHVCNSAAAIRLPCLYPDVCFDGVRFGISLYGYGVSPAPHHTYALRPAMTLKTRVIHIHRLCPGEIVSYSGRYRADMPRTIATLPIGYADGFRRGFEGAFVTVRTARGDVCVPVVGRICMDQCMLDVTDLGVNVGDEVTLFGQSTPFFEAPQASLEALCERANTIPYEILCQITARVPRVTI